MTDISETTGVEVRMPQLGESVTEGTVGRWLKRVGEPVARFEPLLEIETDKVAAEVPSPAEGVLAEILVAEGATVAVGTPIARLAGPGGTPEPAPAQPQRGAHPPISPVVARMAAEHGLDLSLIDGTGAGGRVSKQDVLRYLERRAATTDGIRPTESQPPPAAPSAPPALLQEERDEEVIPLTGMRQAIAEHMARSASAAPHATTIFEVDMWRVAAHRERVAADLAQQGLRPTYTAYIVQAAARALRAVPALNSRYAEGGIARSRRVHVGVAVALDDGLIVPVVRDADELSLRGVARAVADLAERARARRLAPEEVRGGTFTVTNHGVGGSVAATPILNQPQSGILGVGAIVRRPVVVGEGPSEAIAIRPICMLSLTFDHRVCDGAEADRFLAQVKRFLETYEEA